MTYQILQRSLNNGSAMASKNAGGLLRPRPDCQGPTGAAVAFVRLVGRLRQHSTRGRLCVDDKYSPGEARQGCMGCGVWYYCLGEVLDVHMEASCKGSRGPEVWSRWIRRSLARDLEV